MRKFLSVLFMAFLLCGCSKDENEEILVPENNQKIKLCAVNLVEDTESADALFLCEDGSYIVCDVNAGNGYGFVYMNPSIDNELTDGVMIIVDSDGSPVMANWGDQYIIFENLTDSGFDCAYIDCKGEITYQWNVAIEECPVMMASRAWYSPWTDSWKELWRMATTGSWDEHNKKALLPFSCKIASFIVTVIGKDYESVGFTFACEVLKSSNINEEDKAYWKNVLDFSNNISGWIEGGWKGLLTDGQIKFSRKNFTTALLASMLNDIGDEGLKKLGERKEEIDNVFSNKEWQIKLSKNLLEFGCDEAEERVDVSTLVYWEIDDRDIDRTWCSVYKDGNQIVVKVKPYEDGVSTRVCSARIKTYATNVQIPPAVLTIRQESVMFDLSESTFTFSKEGGSKGVYVYKNDNITSWEVVAPDWCKITRGENSFFIDVEPSEFDRKGIIDVVGMVRNTGSYITRQIIVEQIGGCDWDGTTWSFNGNVTATGNATVLGGFNAGNVTNFGLHIESVANNEFSLSGDLAVMQGVSDIRLDEGGRLVWTHYNELSESGVYMEEMYKIIFTRIENTKAVGNLSGFANVKTSVSGGGNVNVNVNFNGTFNGTLQSE